LDVTEEIAGESRFFLGADARIATPTLPIVINPLLDWYFVDDLNFWTLKANALYPIGVDNATFTPYAGGGLGIYTASGDNIENETEFGLNILFGATIASGASFSPFVEAEYSVVFSSPENLNLFSLKGGLLFNI
jgi:hypothetical protein